MYGLVASLFVLWAERQTKLQPETAIAVVAGVSEPDDGELAELCKSDAELGSLSEEEIQGSPCRIDHASEERHYLRLHGGCSVGKEVWRRVQGAEGEDLLLGVVTSRDTHAGERTLQPVEVLLGLLRVVELKRLPLVDINPRIQAVRFGRDEGTKNLVYAKPRPKRDYRLAVCAM
jgi:hypothetical protein